ncbi:MAG: hypothetical protein JJU33_03330 [Phycisphaerales bacterium]|nr:hypothetical protein [Phycisphaerales bacterium]
MGFIDRILARFRKPGDHSDEEQGVIIEIPSSGDVSGVPAIADLEDELEAAIEDTELGELDGNEFGPEGVRIFFYGPDADRLAAAFVPVLGRHRFPAGTIIEKQYDLDADDRVRVPLEDLIGRG